jgi:hypothetical protein
VEGICLTWTEPESRITQEQDRSPAAKPSKSTVGSHRAARRLCSAGWHGQTQPEQRLIAGCRRIRDSLTFEQRHRQLQARTEIAVRRVIAPKDLRTVIRTDIRSIPRIRVDGDLQPSHCGATSRGEPIKERR